MHLLESGKAKLYIKLINIVYINIYIYIYFTISVNIDGVNIFVILLQYNQTTKL